MSFGLKEKDYQFIVRHLKSVLGEKSKVWCFGSRARGDYSKYSDLDLMLEKIDISIMGELEEFFVESDLPIKVDIVIKENFAKSYLDSFERDKIPFY
ncbi:MAG: nucleotidyltransferase family protein [Bacteriovoracaceae bacterium]